MIANESYVNKLSLLFGRGGFPVVETLDPPKESVLELAAASVGHQSLDVLPLLTVLVYQRNQSKVLLQGPFLRVQTRLKEILVVVLELLEGPVRKIFS